MHPVDLLHDWLAHSALRSSTRAEYQREVSSWIDWCALRQADPVHLRLQDVADWSHDRYLEPYLDGRPFNGPDALGHLARRHPEVARSHDRRITALSQYLAAAHDRGLLPALPDLAPLRSGVTRPREAHNRLTPRERAVLLHTLGSWGPAHSQHHRRDQLAVHLLLEGLRPAQIVGLDLDDLHPLPDGSYDARARAENSTTGRKFTLDPITGTVLHAYLRERPTPADGSNRLLLNHHRKALQSRWLNVLVQQIAALHPLLAERNPPVTADAVAHTGLWDEPGRA